MNDDRPPPKRWLERLSLALLGEPQDRQQLIELLRHAHQRDLLDIDGLSMVEGVLAVSEMQVRDIMIPRSQMDVVQQDEDLQTMLPSIIETAHSRFPVIGDDRDDVVGILLAKDLLRYFRQDNSEAFSLSDILRPAVFVPESKRLNVLLREFRVSRNHMAIVVDEYGGVAGLVTIEDVLEQIVGDIDDEHDFDVSSTHILRHSNGRYTVKALTPIDEFNGFFGTSYSEEDFDTIGGLVMSRFGHVPERGEEIVMDGFVLRVLRADNRRVHLLELREKPAETATMEGGA
ncbi:MAG: transporter associated domain-containing protein [Chromatiales bacterium]|jgi:magnesium and cobalt transporter|nr:transporter associated domain-containing protein [Chromatiales bacterium]MDX9767961.1 transporter associated domain-containing protein [Ectothiorhodospiraceae bacterium]